VGVVSVCSLLTCDMIGHDQTSTDVPTHQMDPYWMYLGLWFHLIKLFRASKEKSIHVKYGNAMMLLLLMKTHFLLISNFMSTTHLCCVCLNIHTVLICVRFKITDNFCRCLS